MNLDDIRSDILKCTKCELYKTKTKYVIGEGNSNAKVMFIGEAPGANEDLQGRPFVGRAGQIFDDLLKSINIKREDIYICNILKCRPPGNRSPLPTEIEQCTSYLNQQIEAIKPKVICPMGNFAVGFVMKKFGAADTIQGISKLHGKVFHIRNLFDDIIVIPLYHPAVATYNPYMKEILQKDIKVLEKY